MDETKTTAIQRAADDVGVPAIARACRISAQAVYKWLKKGQAPTGRCEAISRATGGRVSTFDLLPPSLRAVVASPAAAHPTRRASDKAPPLPSS
jgi:DNA-binding transcriptional regulator YdaS (Cro superfamily)